MVYFVFIAVFGLGLTLKKLPPKKIDENNLANIVCGSVSGIGSRKKWS